MKITFLGVWMASDVGETVSFVVDDLSGERILVDCGTNLVKSLLDADIDPMSITHIIVTHSHGDHISGLPGFLFYRHFFAPGIYKKANNPLTIISSNTCIEAIKKYIGVPYPMLVESKSISYCVVNECIPFTVGNMTFDFFVSKHSPLTYGFTCKNSKTSFVYSSDSSIDESIIAHAHDADLLIHDVAATSDYTELSGGHTLCNQISPLLGKYNIKKFIPVHRISIYSEDIFPYLHELEDKYNGEIIIPQDGMTVLLDNI